MPMEDTQKLVELSEELHGASQRALKFGLGGAPALVASSQGALLLGQVMICERLEAILEALPKPTDTDNNTEND